LRKTSIEFKHSLYIEAVFYIPADFNLWIFDKIDLQLIIAKKTIHFFFIPVAHLKIVQKYWYEPNITKIEIIVIHEYWDHGKWTPHVESTKIRIIR
jgi:hypothetical protein